MKHNKKRNPGLLYEVLVQELTKCVIKGDENRKKIVSSIIKQHFRKGTELRKEMELFRALCEGSHDEATLLKILEETKKEKAKLSESRLRKEKDALVARINHHLGHEVYDNFVPNYRTMASIAQILDGRTKIPQRIKLEESFVRSASKKEETLELEPIDGFTLKVFAKKFNEKYSGLLSEQKELLNRFVMSNEQDIEFKLYLNEEIGRLKKSLKRSQALIEDDEIRHQAGSVLKLLETYRNEEPSESLTETILRVQELCDELAKTYPQLREAAFAELHPKRSGWQMLTKSQMEEHPEIAQNLFDMLDSAYSAIGGHPNFKGPNDFVDGEEVVYAIDVDEDPEADALKAFKERPSGKKFVAGASDGSAAGKDALMSGLVADLTTPGYYAEVSGAVAHIILSRHKDVKSINDPELVKNILGKKINWIGPHPDGKYPGHSGWYERSIGGETHMKILVGLPSGGR